MVLSSDDIHNYVYLKSQKKKKKKGGGTSKMATNVEYKFLDEVSSAGFRCYLCSKVARSPYQHCKCGTLFCFECLQEYGMFNKPCKRCNETRPQYFEDNRSEYDGSLCSAQQYCSCMVGWKMDLSYTFECHNSTDCC